MTMKSSSLHSAAPGLFFFLLCHFCGACQRRTLSMGCIVLHARWIYRICIHQQYREYGPFSCLRKWHNWISVRKMKIFDFCVVYFEFVSFSKKFSEIKCQRRQQTKNNWAVCAVFWLECKPLWNSTTTQYSVWFDWSIRSAADDAAIRSENEGIYRVKKKPCSIRFLPICLNELICA